MPLYFRVFAVFVLFAVHALAFYWTTVALAGEKLRWRWYFVFYAGYCAVEWAAMLLIILIDTSRTNFLCQNIKWIVIYTL